MLAEKRVKNIAANASHARQHLLDCYSVQRNLARGAGPGLGKPNKRVSAAVSSVTEKSAGTERRLWDMTAWHSICFLENRGAEAVIKLAQLDLAEKEGRISFDRYSLMARLCGIDAYGIEQSKRTARPKYHTKALLASGAAHEIEALYLLITKSRAFLTAGEIIELKGEPITEFDAWSFDKKTAALDIYEIKGSFYEEKFIEEMFGVGIWKIGAAKKHCKMEVLENPLNYGETDFLNAVQTAKRSGKIRMKVLCKNYASGPVQQAMTRGVSLYGILSRMLRGKQERENIRISAQLLIDGFQERRGRLLENMVFTIEKFQPATIPADGRRGA